MFKYYIGEPQLRGGQIFWPVVKTLTSQVTPVAHDIGGVILKQPFERIINFHPQKYMAQDEVDRLTKGEENERTVSD